MKRQDLLKNGFTLLETVLAVSILGFAFLAISTVIVGIGKASFNARKAADTMTSKELFTIAITNSFKDAINVDWTSANINNIGAARGRIRRFQSGVAASATSAPLTLGLFLRDTGINQSDIRATALFLKEPTTNLPGTLMLSTSTGGSGLVRLNSNMSELKADSIVEVNIEPGGFTVPDGQPVRVLKIKTVQRYFSSGTPNTWRWCPARMLNTAACRTNDLFKDVENFQYITLDKNLIDTGIGTPGVTKRESIHGDIYFFRKMFVAN